MFHGLCEMVAPNPRTRAHVCAFVVRSPAHKGLLMGLISLCPRYSHLTSASSMWSRCGSSCLQLCRGVSLRLLLSRTSLSFSCLHFLTPLTPPGAVQVPVPHQGSDVLLSTPKCQSPFSEPQGDTKAPFPLFHPPTPSDQDLEDRRVITTIAYPTPGLLLEAGTDSLYLPLTCSLLPYQTVPSSAYPLEPIVISIRSLARFLKA